MRTNHEVLLSPLCVPHKEGRLTVLKKAAKIQDQMGEALTLDGIVNSIDAELIAKGTSAKGPNRGAIVRHGRYTLWGFEGPVENMTEEGKAMFINTVYYAAKHAEFAVLERKKNSTRDNLFDYISLAENQDPGFLRTLEQYIPESERGKSIEETGKWLKGNRPYLYIDGRVFRVDELARSLEIPNYRREYLQRCINNLKQAADVERTLTMLRRYTGRDFGSSPKAWQQWYDDNYDYLFFSDTDGTRFIIDQQAKEKQIPSEQFRNWSSEQIDYRVYDNPQ